MEMKNMCNRITPYRCPKCGNDLLFFETKFNKIIDYKGLMDKSFILPEIKEYLGTKGVKYIRCISCKESFIIDWSNGYPVPLIDKNKLKSFGY